MNEFLLLVIVIVHLAINPLYVSQRKIISSRTGESNELR